MVAWYPLPGDWKPTPHGKPKEAAGTGWVWGPQVTGAAAEDW